MANDSKNDDFPTIKLDEEDRRAYQQKKQPAPGGTKKNTPPPSSTASAAPPARSGGNGLWLVLVALIALAGVGGCYYLFTLLQQQQQVADQAETRIAELEKKLSATGEEIGESTVALQVKVNELTNKTNELWEQMDKLWASAWRRNQQEIANLGERITSVKSGLEKNVDNVSGDIKQQASQVSALRNQLANLADELLAVNVQLEQAASDKQQRVRAIENVNDKLSVLEQRSSTLSGRISSLENELRDIATKVVTRSTPPSGSAPPDSEQPAQ